MGIFEFVFGLDIGGRGSPLKPLRYKIVQSRKDCFYRKEMMYRLATIDVSFLSEESVKELLNKLDSSFNKFYFCDKIVVGKFRNKHGTYVNVSGGKHGGIDASIQNSALNRVKEAYRNFPVEIVERYVPAPLALMDRNPNLSLLGRFF